MTRGANGCLADGLRLLARRKAVVLYVYLAYFAFGAAAFLGAMTELNALLSNSLYSRRLADGFDLSALIELLGRPDFVASPLAVRGIVGGIGLGLALWFSQAGILAEFLSPENLGAERFFQTCGSLWWRFVRLVLLTWLILLPTMGVLSAIRSAMVDAADKSWHLRLPFILFVSASVIMQLIGLVLRGWFDTAELDMVHHGRPKARKSIGEARRLTRGHRLQILWIYLVPAVVMWAITAGLVFLWLATPARAVGLAFLVTQAIILAFITCRMWQRAAQATWFLAHVPVEVALPIIEAPVITEPAPPPSPEPLIEPPQPEMDLP